MSSSNAFLPKQTRWGRWRLEKSNWTLVHTDEDGKRSEIDLERMDTTGEMLDWIFQISGKAWATRQDVGDLIPGIG